MEPKKNRLLIGVFIAFWIILIAWGMLKTTVKLSQKGPLPKGPVTQPKVQAVKKEEAPAQPVTAPSESRAIPVRVFKVKPADFKDVLPVMGTVKGKTEIELKFEVNGIIKSISFREGAKIGRGDSIACLDPKDLELRVAYAKNKLNSAQAGYNSLKKKLEVHKKLFEAGAILKSKLEEVELESESAKFQAETAKNELELTENELGKGCLYAVKDGVMGPRKKEEGEFVTPQDKIGSLLETGEVFVEVGVVERDIDKIKLGQNARVYVDAYPNVTFEGKIDNIFPVVEGKSRTLTVKIKVSNPEGLLFSGMFARAEILIIELKNASMVPATALIEKGKGVTLIPSIPKESIKEAEGRVEEGTIELRKVNVGYVTSDYAQVKEGLKAGDLVVIEAQGELQDNTPVRIVGTEEASF